MAKSSHSTLYHAATRSGVLAMLLWFMQPACDVGSEEASVDTWWIGAVMHSSPSLSARCTLGQGVARWGPDGREEGS